MSFSDDEILDALLRIKNGDKSMRRHDNIVVGSLIRRRVRLISTDRTNPSIASGAEGWVRYVGGGGTLMVEWDRSDSIQELDPGIDRWEWLGPPPPIVRFPDGVILDALLRIKNSDRSMRHVDEPVVESLRGRRVRLVSMNDEYTGSDRWKWL
jgi:hypothetical protein